MVFRPATPGFLVTLIATILLAVVSFSVPWFKSVFFLKASLSNQGQDGSVTFGTLGYCIELNNGTTCSKPSIGYQFNPNALLGDNIKFLQIPEIVVKWITYVLFLHVVALILAAIASVFGLLAHVREMAMTCFSSCISGFAATVAFVAFIFDIAFFFIAKKRINAVPGGSAAFGNAIWLTLAAWLLLFFSGCFFSLGRCCIRGRSGSRFAGNGGGWGGTQNNDGYANQARLDAVKAEAERKARQKQTEIGLPAFQEHEMTKPLKSNDYSGTPQYLEEEDEPYKDLYGSAPVGAAVGAGAAYGRRQGSEHRQYHGGYVQAPVGSRAVDEYYSPTQANTYPPPPSRSPALSPALRTGTPPNRSPSSVYSGGTNHNQYLSTAGQTGHNQFPSAQDYGHTAGGTSYHTATSHERYPSPYGDNQNTFSQPTFNPDTYNASAALGGFAAPVPNTSYSTPSLPYPQDNRSYQTSAYTAAPSQQPERSYTLGGGGYGANTVPDTHAAENAATSYNPYGGGPTSPTSPRGPRPQRDDYYSTPNPHEDSLPPPPEYESGASHPAGAWGTKG